MAGRMFKQMGVEKDLADEVKSIIQGRGEIRRRKERQLKLEAHKELQQSQQADKAKRKKERAMRHKEMLEAHRRYARRHKKKNDMSATDK